MSDVLRARGLEKTYRRGRAVDGVDLTVRRGERVALLGPNGAGKTTTLLMCLGVVEPDGGTVEIAGHRLPRGRSAAMAHVGFAAGYRGGVVDELLSMLTNVVLVIPTLAVLIIVAAYLTVRGLVAAALLIGLTSWPWAARAIRAYWVVAILALIGIVLLWRRQDRFPLVVLGAPIVMVLLVAILTYGGTRFRYAA